MTMSFGSISLSLLFAALATPILNGQPTTAPASLPNDPAALIAMLSHEETAVREEAARALAETASLDLDLLRKARESATDPDLQLRLDTLIVDLGERSAVGATLITMKYDSVPLKTVLDDLASQSGATFSDLQQLGGEIPIVSVDLDHVTFWKTIDQVQAVANINFVPQGETWQVMRGFGNKLFSGGVEAGAFLVQPISASYNRSVNYTRNGGGNENFNLSLQMITEPKIKLAQSSAQFQLIRAVDSKGNDLAGVTQNQQYGTGQNANSIQVNAMLNYPADPGDRIAEISGVLRLSMARHVETISVDDFGSPGQTIEREFENARLTITSQPEVVPPAAVTGLFVIETRGNNQAMTRLNQSIRSARVFDRNNMALRLNEMSPQSSDGQRMVIRASFMSPRGDQPAGPFRLVLDIPTSFRDLEVPFTLRDLKMP